MDFKIRNASRIFVGKLTKKEDGRMTLSFNLGKYVLKNESGYNRFTITFNGGLWG
jgi:hypothetical protein